MFDLPIIMSWQLSIAIIKSSTTVERPHYKTMTKQIFQKPNISKFFSRKVEFVNESTLRNLVASVSVPVTEFFPERRILIDWCFQMGYDMPHQLSSFYNIPIWPGKHSPKYRRRSIISDPWPENNHWKSLEAYNTSSSLGMHPSDFSAGELYQSLEDLLVSYGFHETCLLRSVCELARHPFDEEENQNILTDIITFILTPSQHEGFTSSETVYQEAYEEAERSGFLDANCSHMYPDCKVDLLSLLTQTSNVH
ncbi:uncharacterized protein LOC142220017 [Haematobia irritans]|uniref:uncharacterized protein LOC142220017 n=1 Tax=Haematobia irritans TaxID=7368 RepID=UPI003F500ED2